MRNLSIDDLMLINGGAQSCEFFDSISYAYSLVCGSLFAGAAIGHVSGSLFGYHIAASAGPIVATCSGLGLGILGAYVGANVLGASLIVWGIPDCSK